MSDAAIKKALEVAGEAVRHRARFSPLTGMALSQDFAAAAIAAFLDAMNPHNRRAGFNLARAVEEAAAVRRAAGGE